MIELGRVVKDKSTGFTGLAEANLTFLNGCEQILVRPKMTPPKKGEQPKFPEGVYIDVEFLVHVGKTKIKPTLRTDDNGEAKPSGGVRCHPEQRIP